ADLGVEIAAGGGEHGGHRELLGRFGGGVRPYRCVSERAGGRCAATIGQRPGAAPSMRPPARAGPAPYCTVCDPCHRAPSVAVVWRPSQSDEWGASDAAVER